MSSERKKMEKKKNEKKIKQPCNSLTLRACPKLDSMRALWMSALVLKSGRQWLTGKEEEETKRQFERNRAEGGKEQRRAKKSKREKDSEGWVQSDLLVNISV